MLSLSQLAQSHPEDVEDYRVYSQKLQRDMLLLEKRMYWLNYDAFLKDLCDLVEEYFDKRTKLPY